MNREEVALLVNDDERNRGQRQSKGKPHLDPQRRRLVDPLPESSERVFSEEHRRLVSDGIDPPPIRYVDDEPPGVENASTPLKIPSPAEPMAVARDFIAAHYSADEVMLLVRHGGNWYVWDGSCWPERDEKQLRSQLYRWSEHAVFSKKKPKTDEWELVAWNPNRYKVADAVDALGAVTLLDTGMVAPCWIDEPIGLLTTAESDVRHFAATEMVAMHNGLLHLPTRTLLPHTPGFFVHHALPFGFDANASEPARWLKFLGELWEDDDDAIDALQELFGYVLSGETDQQKIALLVGPKRSGKGTIGRVLTGLLGRHNVASPTLAGIATNFGLSPLIDKPLALISDARLSGRTDASIVVERLLSISGEDILTVDRKYREPWTGYFPTRFMILTNELPQMSDSSGAFASRILAWVLTKSFYGHEDKKLTDKLLAEASGIFNWALDGLDRLRTRGYFLQPDSSRDAIDRLEDLASPVSAFIAKRCEIGPGLAVPVDDLYGAWRRWCDEEGIEHISTKSIFARDLNAAVPGVRNRRTGPADNRTHRYFGIRLRSRPNNGKSA